MQTKFNNDKFTIIYYTEQIPVEAAWLHDAVWVYARALATALTTGEGARDGRAIVARIRNTTYRSIMGLVFDF